MTRLSLPRQIALVFTLAFVPAALFMGAYIVGSLHAVYERNVYESLEAEGKALRMQTGEAGFESASHIAYIRYDPDGGAYTASDNLPRYADDDGAALLIAKAAAQQESMGRYVNRVDGRILYYAVLRDRGFFGIRPDDILIVLTDTALINQMVRDTTVRLLEVCLAAFGAGILILFLWTRLLARDIKGIRNGVIAMGVNHYKTRLQTRRRDELGELVENIEFMRRRIVDQERSRQTIIEGVSHDLKTPIGVIASYAAAVKDGLCEPAEAADITLRQTRRLTDKVNRLLQLTRLGHLNIEQVKAESVRMDTLVEELVSACAYQTPARIVSALEPVCFTGDEESWRIAVENLLDNAVRYARDRIAITLTDGSLWVWNDGKPLREADIPTLFDAYEKSRDGKFGLGLSIVRRTAELFGYEAAAQNLDGGVCFSILRRPDRETV